MKKVILKLLIGTALFLGACDAIYAQKIHFPTNVRYIGGGYIAKKPYYPTLEGALNNVKALATASNPYTFWVDSDTLFIADWDSVFTASGLTMKDSIDVYYVNTGKIKWAGFGFGGSGTSGTVSIAAPSENTTHYDYPKWDPTTAPAWQDSLTQALDSIDQHIWDLIVYTDTLMYIENDTLKLHITNLKAVLEAAGISGGSGWNPDTNRVVRVDVNSTMAGAYLITGSVKASGNGMLAMGSYHDGSTPRVIYANSDSMMTTLDGSTIKTLAFRDWVRANYTPISYIDTIPRGGQAWFTGTDTTVTITVAGIDTSSIVVVTALNYGGVNPLSVILGSGSFAVRRAAAAAIDGLKFNWVWVRGK